MRTNKVNNTDLFTVSKMFSSFDRFSEYVLSLRLVKIDSNVGSPANSMTLSFRLINKRINKFLLNEISGDK